jgi:hypothetical protein
MVNNTNNVWRLLWTLIHEWFQATFLHFFIVHTILIFRKNNNNDRNNEQGKFENQKIF